MSPNLEILEIEGVRGLLSLGPKILRILEIGALFPTSGHFGNFGHILTFSGLRTVGASRGAGARLGTELRSIFVSQAEVWTHVTAGSPLHTTLSFGALHALASHFTELCPHAVLSNGMHPAMLTVRNAVTTQHLEKSTFKSAHEPLKM